MNDATTTANEAHSLIETRAALIRAITERDEAIKELHRAWRNTCNLYSWAGHAKRVADRYGFEEPTDEEQEAEEKEDTALALAAGAFVWPRGKRVPE